MIIYSMFDGSGLMVQPWAEAGHTCYCFNYDDANHGNYSKHQAKVQHPNIHYINVWIDDGFPFYIARAGIDAPDIVFSFPPCDNLAVSGSRHFARKLKENPICQIEAVAAAKAAHHLADVFGVPYMIENPVSVMSSIWRKPDYIFNPCEYGGYLAEDDSHPFFPDVIPARDAYNKKTCLWTGNGFVMPDKRPVDAHSGANPGWEKLGGKSARTKMIRSLTPRGFACAVYEENKK